MTEHPLSFTVAGVPQPKGSTQAFGNVVLDGQQPDGFARNKRGRVVVRTRTTSDNDAVKAWQSTIAKTAWVAKCEQWPKGERGHTLTGPVEISIGFLLKAPQRCKPGTAHVTKPDMDKLIRAVFDGLTGVVWVDDAQVTDLHTSKRYAFDLDGPRAVITIRPVAAPLFAAGAPDVSEP